MADTEDNVTAPEVEAQAREMGWRPKGEFKGAEEKWVDAATFVERGEHVLPIIKATNDRLRGDLTRTSTELKDVREALAASQEAIKGLERYHQEDVKQKVEKARAELKAQIVSAKKAGDVEAEVDLTEQLTTLNVADATALAKNDDAAAPTKKTETTDYTTDPVFIAWKEDNPWFGTDRAKTAIAYDIVASFRAAGDKTTGRPFLDKVAVKMSEEVSRLGGGRQSKTEEGKGGAGGQHGGGNGKSKNYNDLPSEAKEACRSYERELVGPNRKYADVAAWHKAYAEQYFAEV